MIKQSGFSLLELIIVVAIMALLVGVALWTVGGFQRAAQLEATETLVINVLEKAKAQTLNSTHRTNYGVYFETNRLVLFAGLDYDEAEETNQEYLLPANLIMTADFEGNQAVVFERLTGRPLVAGQVVIQVETDPDQERIIVVSPAGRIGSVINP